jgi:uncharacterized repeat protein (TIGR03803 family)
MLRMSAILKIIACGFVALFSLPLANAVTLHNYHCGTGEGYVSGLTKDGQGNYYGVSALGGGGNVGVAFELSPNGQGGWSCSVIYTFVGSGDGANPESTLVMDAHGNLFGTATSGGFSGAGTVFELSQQNGAWSISNAYEFTGGADGSYPMGALAIDAAGNIYGATEAGGIQNGGTVFEVIPSTNQLTLKTLHTFGSPSDGYHPFGGVIMDRGGNLYGTTWQGGVGGNGVVFKLRPAGPGWIENILYAFSAPGQGGPESAPSFDNQGALIGSVVTGAVYRLTPSPTFPRTVEQPWSITWLYTFPNQSNLAEGFMPIGAPIMDSAGNIYGTTSEGGNTNFCSPVGCGVVYKLTPSHDNGPTTYTETVLWTFQGYPNGQEPDAILTLESSGSFLSTTGTDGPFELTP